MAAWVRYLLRCYEKSGLGLKKLVFKTVLRKNHIQEYEMRGDKVVKGLFCVYDDAELNRDLILLPPELRARGDKECRKRLVCDYISGMMILPSNCGHL
ncbi:hypothetical protein [Halomonas colorata]